MFRRAAIACAVVVNALIIVVGTASAALASGEEEETGVKTCQEQPGANVLFCKRDITSGCKYHADCNQ